MPTLKRFSSVRPLGPMVHILATGDGNILQPLLEPYPGFYVENSSIIDIRLSFVFQLWTIASVLAQDTLPGAQETAQSGINLRKAAIAYVAEDVNSLIYRAIKPIEPLGEQTGDNGDRVPSEGATLLYPMAEKSPGRSPLFTLGTLFPTISRIDASPTSSEFAATSASVAATSSGPSARFEWKMNDRYGLDRDNDGLIDYDYSYGYVHPQSFTVHLDGCSSLPESNRAGASYKWTIPAVTTRTDGCAIDQAFLAQGPYSVTFTVTDRNGQADSLTQSIDVKDLLIISIGDSAASGQGNPDIKARLGFGAKWEDRQCDRSANAGPALAALEIERNDPPTSVTFIHLACSGASIPEGLLGEYKGQEEGFPKLPPQIDKLAQLLCPVPTVFTATQVGQTCRNGNGDVVSLRPVHALTLSMGANDVEFGDAIIDCVLKSPCYKTPSFLDKVETDFDSLPDHYRWLNGNITQKLGNALPPSRIFITEYPDTLKDENGNFCSALAGIHPDETNWLNENFVARLNQNVRNASILYGWNLVGIFSDFTGHGYCASNTYIRHIFESFIYQGNKNGVFHPNIKGHCVYRNHLYQAITGRSLSAECRTVGSDPPDQFDFIKIPRTSGIEGPAGKIIDLLLEGLDNLASLLETGVGAVLRIAGEILIAIEDAVMYVLSPLLELGASAVTGAKVGSVEKAIPVIGTAIGNIVNRLTSIHLPINALRIGLGDLSLLTLSGLLDISFHFSIDGDALVQLSNQVLSIFGRLPGGSTPSFFDIFSAFQIAPTLIVGLKISEFGTEKGILKQILDFFGASLRFSGGAKLAVELFRIGARLGSIGLLRVLEFAFRFSLGASLSFTLSDFFEKLGTGGHVLSEVADYVGLSRFHVDVFVRVALEIVWALSKSSRLVLDVAVGMSADLTVAVITLK
ncbi:hypothetical protein E6H36_07805, partial [Candidatus Bathyarchaeota archaeon]